MYYMGRNPIDPMTNSRGSVVLVASTSGYFGGTGVVSYISSKHGVIGLLRSSQKTATQHQIRVNGVAPFFSPTYITGGYSEKWKEKGLPANTTVDVAQAIVSSLHLRKCWDQVDKHSQVQTAADPSMSGACCLAAGQKMYDKRLMSIALQTTNSLRNEIEKRLGNLVPEWVGSEMHSLMVEGGRFFDDLGGYPLPPARP